MIESQFATQIEVESKIFGPLCLLAFDDTKFHPYYNFGVKIADGSMIERDPFLASLLKVHPFLAGVLRIPPNTVYNWHTDTNRGASLNMLLEGGEYSHCLFADEPLPEVASRVSELVYEPKRYHLLNTQEYHCVINMDTPRFMFSLEFLEDKHQLSYYQLKTEIEQGDYIQ